ncbi:HAD-IIB family hydrolase [Deinococcus koreensis]|uniref:HAD family phosphatase n=1 Tax=Deinococcus koreensis TaxID=2054903 RepID=A0A2K3V097_9DEIO|nr:HAD family hydrolase [Deinococcus koreensis]PNY82203.1 HAD family phosphatase [Deinococcus koreensis]
MTPAPAPTGLPLLMAFDLDGTLIPERGDRLQDDVATALSRLRAQGVKLAIITGRDMAPEAVREAMQPHAVASNNGGRIEIDGTLHTEAIFTPDDLEAVLAHELDGARAILFTEGGLYVDIPPGYEPEPWMVLRGYRPLAEAPRDSIQKVGYFHPHVAGFAAQLRESHPHLVLTGAQEPYPHFLTVTPTGAHKGAALALIADALGVPHERTVAFGDSDNDEAMLEIAGYAVQVGTLPLLSRHAHVRVEMQVELGTFLSAWADRLGG